MQLTDESCKTRYSIQFRFTTAPDFFQSLEKSNQPNFGITPPPRQFIADFDHVTKRYSQHFEIEYGCESFRPNFDCTDKPARSKQQ